MFTFVHTGSKYQNRLRMLASSLFTEKAYYRIRTVCPKTTMPYYFVSYLCILLLYFQRNYFTFCRWISLNTSGQTSVLFTQWSTCVLLVRLGLQNSRDMEDEDYKKHVFLQVQAHGTHTCYMSITALLCL